uniref:Uncharacterized protein n=1 Tax=Amphimedon queenslandica TaxID=400682 RepID=A0A1X7TE78_AMPQE
SPILSQIIRIHH